MKTKASKPKRQYVQDARARQAEATGERIVSAFLDRLMAQWFDEITLDRVAADAGVTVQTIVRRFGGKDGLLADAVKVLGRQINTQRTTRPGDIDQMVTNLMADYEQTGEAILRLLALEARQPALTEFLNFGRAWHRSWVEEALVGSLANLGNGTRKRALDALVIATDVYTWKLLRRDMARSVPATAATIGGMVRAVLGEFAKSNSRGDAQ